MSRKKKNYLAALAFFLIMLLDAHLTSTFVSWGNGVNRWTVHLLLLVLMFCVPKFSQRYMLLIAIALGAVFDIYYLGVLGVYAVSLPLAVWAMQLLADILYQNFFTLFFGMIILITAYEAIIAGIQLLFKMSVINPVVFITQVLGPTLLINMLLFLVVSGIFRLLSHPE